MTSDSVPVLASELRMVTSQHTGREYRITISLPLGYNAPAGESWPFGNQPAKWPVVYVTDANWYFGIVTDVTRYMMRCGQTADAIIVGIGYVEDADSVEAYRVSFTRRDADLTPVRDEAEEASMTASQKRPVPNGDAGNFLKFLTDELMPMVERAYRADPAKRVFLGHSYGGLFGAFALFEAPGLFDTLILGSPWLIYGNRWTFQREETYAREHNELRAKVYLFAGEYEENANETTVTDMLRFAAILQGRGYEGLTVVSKVFADLNHCEVFAPGFQAGLKLALKK